ncbi:MAG TPA: DUF484 family protein [Chromatiales bacterium]|nr:DUF484 family protein [Chromatiales bacterium]
MTTQTSTELKHDEALTEEEVEAWLYEHPDFFARHEALLEVMHVPHPTFGVTSLLERQVALLRNKNHQLEGKLRGLVGVARENEKLSSRLHNLALALVEADNLDAVIATAREQLLQAFNADYVALKLFAQEGQAKTIHHVDQKEVTELFDRAFRSNRPQCGGLNEKQINCLFPEHTEKVASAVLVPLIEHHPIGYLALGSTHDTRFHPGMGTLFLGYLGELVTRSIVIYQQRES